MSGKLNRCVILVAIISALSCNNVADNATVPSVDETKPTATVFPPSGQTIGGNLKITVSFTESMDTTSLQMSGTLAAQAASAVWTTTNVANDTLIILPTTSWNSGSATLVIIASDSAGNTLGSTLDIDYVIDTNLPGASSISISSGSRITNSAVVVITFNETMKTTSLNLGGSMGLASDRGTWSNTFSENDTLTIGPAATTLWTDGDTILDVSVTDAAGNPFTINLTYTVDSIPPQGTEIPINGLILFNTNNIVIRYSESMNSSSHVYSGSLAADIGSSIWSSSVNVNDTLSISPANVWPTNNQTLDVTAEDMAGNSTVLNLSYPVVSANCSDAVLNQDETAVDCGGFVCAACANGADCLVNTDCVSNSCVSNICQPALDVDGDGSPANLDCDDNDANNYPGNTEICDGQDNNCDGVIDEAGAIGGTTWYQDADLDTYGNAAVSVVACNQPAGYLSNALDCDDTLATVFPGAIEICNNIDDNCSGGIDEGLDSIDTANCTSNACTGGVMVASPIPVGISCRAATGPCDIEEICDGASTFCPADSFQPDGLACDDGDATTTIDICTSGICAGTPGADGASCLINSDCISGLCTSGICAASGSEGTSCSAALPCQAALTCILNICTNVACGDGVVDGIEECDSGGVDSVSCDGATCTFPVCGDGYANTVAGEECDDGNNINGDGCDATCLVEP